MVNVKVFQAYCIIFVLELLSGHAPIILVADEPSQLAPKN
jgi:hypothetical protein